MDDPRWYALRAFRNMTQPLMREVQEAGHRVFYAGCLSNIFFVKCPVEWLKEFKRSHLEDCLIYADTTKKEPAPIRDQDMENFILITSVQYENPAIDVLEPDIKYTLGEKVRVTEGVYKGAIGTVKRIRKDRKLLVSIPGVAVVAISHIPLQYLEKVQTC
jgi:hypothetical protein